MKKIGHIIWGLLFILVGTILALNALDITDINIFFDGWWTLFIIVPCTIGLFTDKEKTGSMIGLLIGVILLLSCQNFIYMDYLWKLIFPVILVMIGITIIFRHHGSVSFDKEVKNIHVENSKIEERSATFGAINMDYDGEEFNGAELNAIFGGIKLDLRKAKIKKDCVINVSAIFGGVDILVPDNVLIVVKSTPVFGGVGNKSVKPNSDKAKKIYINAVCMFGGVDIK